ncbi:hypothetical protein NYE37_13890 [Thermoactinomyces sp. FSL K6-2592]|jgi:hypothetical protein|uniref:hypothetical protein n=1 Tax=Thermoactinomyces sp. FSL K6-2592 TaxID=2975347 RepID=UPI0030FAACAD
MKKISIDQYHSLIYEKDDVAVEVKNVNITEEEIEKKIKNLADIGLSFRYQLEGNHLVMNFDIKGEHILFDQVRAKPLSAWARLGIGRKLVQIGEYFEHHKEELTTFFRPANFLVSISENNANVWVLYRGIRNHMPVPEGYHEEPILEQVKRLILMIFSTAHYDELLLNGNKVANKTALSEYKEFVKRLTKAKSFSDIEEAFFVEELELFSKEESAHREHQKQSLSLLNRVKERKWVLLGGAVFVLALLVAIPLMGMGNHSGPDMSLSYLNGLKAATAGNTEKAIQLFDQVEFEKLSVEDQQVIVQFYIQHDQKNKASTKIQSIKDEERKQQLVNLLQGGR